MIVPNHTEARQVLGSSDQSILLFLASGARDSEVSSVEVKVWIIPVFSRFHIGAHAYSDFVFSSTPYSLHAVYRSIYCGYRVEQHCLVWSLTYLLGPN